MPGKSKLTHLDDRGQAKMVDIGDKPVSDREAVARGIVRMQRQTMRLLLDNKAPKGDVLAVARVAAIQAAKCTPQLIPLCHGITLTSCQVVFKPDEQNCCVTIEARVAARDRTGAEMEALTAVSVGALTIYDMLKAVDRGMTIDNIGLQEKRGGKSGDFKRK